MLISGMCSNSGTIMPAENMPKKTASETRRSNKPIMEKRRRARINNCLNELKNLILDAMKKDPARHSKLEKADILEMTVRHLQILQRHQLALSVAADPNVVNKYRAGFAECASEVTRFISRVETVDTQVKQRLLTHLSNCVSGAATGASNGTTSTPTGTTIQMASSNVDVAPSPSPVSHAPTSSPAVFNGLQLVPTRLPNGDIAFVVPSQYLGNGSSATSTIVRPATQQSPHLPTPSPSSSPHLPLDKPLELTVPRPHISVSPISSSGYRTPSSLSPASSEMSFDYSRPIALIKSPHPRPGSASSTDEQPWRPW